MQKTTMTVQQASETLTPQAQETFNPFNQQVSTNAPVQGSNQAATFGLNPQANGQPEQPPIQSLNQITLKRQVAVKTMVTDAFRARAVTEMTQEQQNVEREMQLLEQQYQANMKQLEQLAQQGQNVAQAVEGLNAEAAAKQGQLQGLYQQLQAQLQELNNVPNGTYVVTGQLENYATVQVGQPIYDCLRQAEILVKDDVVTAILG
jgi:hypothetical protein